MVVVEVQTDQLDDRGRPAPILVTVPHADVTADEVARLAQDIADHARLIGRTFDKDQLARDLGEWRTRPKAWCARLMQLPRRVLRWFSQPSAGRSTS